MGEQDVGEICSVEKKEAWITLDGGRGQRARHQSDSAFAGAINIPLHRAFWFGSVYFGTLVFYVKAKAQQRTKLSDTQRRRFVYDYVSRTVLRDYLPLYWRIRYLESLSLSALLM